MKTEHKISSINHIFLIITLVMWCWVIGFASAECPDLIVNGGEVTVDGGCYGIIFVKNDGKLTINGDTTAQAVLIQWGQCIVNGNLDVTDYITVQAIPTGTMTINGNVSANRISIEGGTLTINGTLYNVSQITLQSGKLTVSTIGSSKEQPIESVIVESGELHLCGNWFVNNMRINSGVVYVIPYSDLLEGSGTFFLACDQLTIETDALINANIAGGDTRGIGANGYGAGGGGYGGKGGNGHQGAAGGNTYGDNFFPTIEMGSRGGDYGSLGGKGGGSISIISTGDVAIYGTVTANGGNGQDYSGGGSGGGVLIHSPNLELTGTIAANGGNGAEFGGGGGGGRIKLFYETGININDVKGKLIVIGGTGGRLAQPGQNGTIWTDAIPNPPELIAPEDGAFLAIRRPTFKFNVIDTSADTDNRDDDLSCIIELSVDNFATIYKTYDQDVSLAGWSKFSYKSGDEAEFTPTEDLPQGVYQWRAAVRDKSIRGDKSLVRSFTLGTPGDVSGNGEVTAYDAALVLQYVVGSKNLSEAQLKAADVTGNGTVSALDAALILQYTVGLITQFPIEITTTAPVITAKSEEGALIKAITQLEAINLNTEQKKVLKQLKSFVFEKSPKYTTLLQNFPNPFNPETWIPYQLAQPGDVTIRIYDVNGKLVRSFELGNKPAGLYMSKDRAAYWNGRNDGGERVTSGIYFYQLQAGESRAIRKAVVSK